MAIIEFKDVGRSYGAGVAQVWALHHVDFVIEPGEFTVLSGPSGSGKTTALNLVGCLDRATNGTVLIQGKNTADMSQKQLAALRGEQIGFIFQSFNLVPVLSAVENVELALQLSGRSAGKRKKASAILSEVGLGDMLHRRPNQLSGGQQQRVAIARALVKAPALVIADEPTANLDSKSGRAVLDLMHTMNQKNGTTFIFSTHDPMVLEYARRIVYLRDGQVHGDVHKEAGVPA